MNIQKNDPRNKADQHLRRFRQEELIFPEGRCSNALYFVVSGKVEISTKRDGSDVTLYTLNEGDWFGEMDSLLAVNRNQSAKAVTDVKLYSVPKEKFVTAVNQSPAIIRQVLTSHYLLQNRMSDRIVDSVGNNTQKSIRNSIEDRKTTTDEQSQIEQCKRALKLIYLASRKDISEKNTLFPLSKTAMSISEVTGIANHDVHNILRGMDEENFIKVDIIKKALHIRIIPENFGTSKKSINTEDAPKKKNTIVPILGSALELSDTTDNQSHFGDFFQYQKDTSCNKLDRFDFGEELATTLQQDTPTKTAVKNISTIDKRSLREILDSITPRRIAMLIHTSDATTHQAIMKSLSPLKQHVIEEMANSIKAFDTIESSIAAREIEAGIKAAQYRHH